MQYNLFFFLIYFDLQNTNLLYLNKYFFLIALVCLLFLLRLFHYIVFNILRFYLFFSYLLLLSVTPTLKLQKMVKDKVKRHIKPEDVENHTTKRNRNK